MKKKRARPNFRIAWPLGLAGVATLIFFAAAFTLAWQIEIDYFDSFNFIMQTRRLFDAELYRLIAYDTSRPRLIVLLLSLWHAPVVWISGSFPGITAVHLFMVLVTAGFLAAWAWLARELWGIATAAFLVLLLVCQPLLLHYSYPSMTDLLSGALLAVYLLCLRRVINERNQQGTTLRSSLILGASGAALALTKHHLVPVLPATLVLFAFLPWKKAAPRRTVPSWKWYLSALGSYAVIVDLATRILGKWGEGIGPHYKHIVRQALASRSEPSDPWLYLDALTQPYSSYPWWVALLVIANAWSWLRKDIHARTSSEKMFLGVAALVTVGFIFLTQATPHREVRYLLPFLPAILLPLAWASARTVEQLEKPKRRVRDVAALFLFFAALYQPVVGSIREFRRFRAEPIYHSDVSGEQAYWRGMQTLYCRRMYACDFAIQAPRPWEYANDDYYRRHDLGPHYPFYLGVGASYGRCPATLQNDYAELVRFWTPPPAPLDPGACYAMPISMVGGQTAMLVQTKCRVQPKTGAIQCAEKKVFPFSLGNASAF